MTILQLSNFQVRNTKQIFELICLKCHVSNDLKNKLPQKEQPVPTTVSSKAERLKQKPLLPHIRREMIDFYGIPTSQIQNIKNGADWVMEDGTVVPNSQLVTEAD